MQHILLIQASDLKMSDIVLLPGNEALLKVTEMSGECIALEGIIDGEEVAKLVYSNQRVFKLFDISDAQIMRARNYGIK